MSNLHTNPQSLTCENKIPLFPGNCGKSLLKELILTECSHLKRHCLRGCTHKGIYFSLCSQDLNTITIFLLQLPIQVRLFTTPWTAAHQASLSLTISQSLPKFMSIELVLPSNCFILHHPFLLLPSLYYPHFIDEETEAQR